MRGYSQQIPPSLVARMPSVGHCPPIRVRYARAAARPPHEVVEGILRCEGAEPGGPDAPSLPGNCSRDANAGLVRFRSREFI